MECVFCKIARGEIPAHKVYEDEEFVAFRDINPQAPTHILIIPGKHIESLSSVAEEDRELLGKLLWVAKRVADELNLKKGYRLVINTGPDGGQEVLHLHVHLLGGRALAWPPG